MKMFRCVAVTTFFLLTSGLSTTRNNSGVLISKYAKVARWGSSNNNNNNPVQETGRSHTVQSIWKPRSTSSSNVKNQVVYQYPVYKKVDEESEEKVPGIGEVIQDRFQVRPYFGYGKIKDSDLSNFPSNLPAAVSTPIRQAPPPSPPPVVNVPLAAPPAPASPPVASPPSLPSPVRPAPFKMPAAEPTPQVPANLYDSPFTSYNPPPDKNADSNRDIFPPNAPSNSENGDSSPSNGDSYADIPISDDGPYNYQPAPKAPEPSPKPSGMQTADLNTYKAIEPHYNSYYDDVGLGYSPNHKHPGNRPSMDSHGDTGPPNYPPKSINDVYYPPDFPKDQISDHNPPMDMAPAMDMAPPMDMEPHDVPKGNGDMTMDLVPPTHDHDFPKYLYDGHHYDHHVYEEVPHTTTTPAPEKKRVSTTNYSYYYLGRKLWYIPLYFSIYFMIYVTALIIKSIARHKVTLRNEWITANSRSARDLTFDHFEAIDNIHRNITIALDKAGKLYSDLSM